MSIADPRGISGLVAWYSAEAETAYANGATITTWTDRSGNGNHATASGTPVWQSSTGRSGGPAVRFGGAGFFTLPNVFSGAAAGEVMVEIKSDGIDCGLWVFDNGSGGSSECHYPYAGVVYEKFGRASFSRLSFTPTLSITSWRRYNVWSASNDWAARLDETSQTTSATNTPTWGSSPILGRGSDGGTLDMFFKGYMSCLVIFNRKLTTSERSDLAGWMAANPAGGVPTTASAVTASPASVGTLAATALAVALVAGSCSSAGTATAAVEVVPEVTAAAASAGGASADVSIIASVTAVATSAGELTGATQGGDLTVTAESIGAALAVVELAPSTSVGPERGRTRTGTAVARWSPPVAPRPATLAPIHSRISAHSYAGITMRNRAGQIQPIVRGRRTAERRRHADRILVNGRDVTYYRGIPTPLPKFGLVEPLLYGSGTLELPQIAAAFEVPGRGALTWLRPGVEVLVQRVAVGGSQAGKVVATDYRGIILGFGTNGRSLTVDLGGDALGRASLRDKQQPLYRRRKDLGRLWYDALAGTDSLRRPFDKVGGTRTGIALYDTGGTGLGEYLSELAGKGVTTSGSQWTCMPAEGGDRAGVYRVRRKDVTTIHATAYLDDAHTVASLQADVSEQPNRIYGTGVTPTGERAKFGVYPMLAITGAAPFPNNASGQAMRRGETDADTDTGGGISALLYRLSVTGYLDIRGLTGGFSVNAARAVRDLQDDANLPLTGRVDRATWAALYDHDIVGYSAKGARIEPIAQLPRVHRLRRNASGQVVGVNRNFDPSALVVDRTLDFGTGVTRAQMREWARKELHATRHWTGTIVLELGAVIRGHHHPGDILGANDLMHARALRPGQNLWLPLWDGGTLFHISGVDIDDQRVTLAVDTRARDTMTVWEVIARNQDNKRSPWRAWVRDHRSSSMSKDAVLEFDEVGGVITNTSLSAGWNVFPVVAGQEGTIGRLRMRLDKPAEFAVAVFGRRMGPNRLAQLIGDPLSHNGALRWGDPDRLDKLVGDHGLVYSAGDDQAPCGYFPGTKETRTYTPQVPNPKYNIDVSPNSDKFDNRETLNEQIPNPAYDPTDPDNDQELIDRVVTEVTTPVTGRWQDDAGFGYRTYDTSVLWVAVYVRHPRTLLGGRIMWPQLESGA